MRFLFGRSTVPGLGLQRNSSVGGRGSAETPGLGFWDLPKTITNTRRHYIPGPSLYP